ncbi:MAG: 1-acyl-sn-glycerol-3-phosphate acyltransferase [Clostridia bacterium]|nr:1-acyl-sn-glycerol-3-phosphate acyltransferase [Clostridia bacterium]
MNGFVYNFVKITGWPLAALIFRTKYYYEDKNVQSRKIKGPAIIVSNHTAISDFMIYMYAFAGRNIHCVMADILYKKNKFMNWFLPRIGGIKVCRETNNYEFINTCKRVLDKGGVVEIYPEARIPKPHEEKPLEFKPSAAYLAMMTKVPIIPLYTNGSYYKKSRARIIIGKPINVAELIDERLSEKDNIEKINKHLRDTIMGLGDELDKRTKEKR